MLLTEQEINAIAAHHGTALGSVWPHGFAASIEQAVIAKLAQGVSVEPSYYWEPDGTIEWMKEGSGFSTNTGPAHGWKITHYYTATAIAAARVAALEEAAVAADLFCNGGESQRPLKYPVATAIRALIGGAT